MVPRLRWLPRTSARRGFTLVEVLAVLALFGLVAALAFAPSVILVRNLKEAREELGREQTLEYFLGRIVAEMSRSPLDFPDGAAVKLVRKDLLGGKADDRLAFWSDWGGETGVRAWMVFRPGPARDGRAGIYRWILPLARPESVDWENLAPEAGRLLGPDFDSLRFSVLPRGEREWSDEYSGPRPSGIRIQAASGGEEHFYEDRLPQD